MSKFFRLIISCCIVSLYSVGSYAKEAALEADISARAEYNDNLFLTDLPHDSTKGLIITPAISGYIKEQNWQWKLRARITNYNYSDDNLDGTDQLFDLSGSYLLERDIFRLDIKHDLDSNLNTTSSDFGTIVGRRVDRRRQSIAPQYTRLVSERLTVQLSYTYTDVDFLEAENTGFVPYITQSGSGYLIFNLTELDELIVSLSAVDYRSGNDQVTYQLIQSQIGINHKFSPTLSTDLMIGTSRQSTTNRQTDSFDLNGQPITIRQEFDSKNRGVVYDAGIKNLLEKGYIEFRLSRSDRTNSFGGLDVVNNAKISYEDEISELWRYNISARYDDIESISSGTTRTDREIFNFESVAYYTLTRNWDMSFSYRYIARKFKSDASDNRAPHSNTVYVGLSYNFPSLSTF